MGLFDNIEVPSVILPAAPTELPEIFHGQTKSLGKSMSKFKIQDGKLYKWFYDAIQTGEEEIKTGDFIWTYPVFVRENEHWGLIEHHGTICFYSSYNYWWCEYEAKFNQGHLESVINMPFRNLKENEDEKESLLRALFGE